MDDLLGTLRAAADPTRLRLLALCARNDLTVSELTQILRQSQPRISRHLKLLCDSGLLDRFPEGHPRPGRALEQLLRPIQVGAVPGLQLARVRARVGLSSHSTEG